MPRPMKLASLIKEIIKVHDWDVNVAADKLGVTPSCINNWLEGDSTSVKSLETAAALAHYTNRNISNVFRGRDTFRAWRSEREAIAANPQRQPPVVKVRRRGKSAVAPSTSAQLRTIADSASSMEEAAAKFVETFVGSGVLSSEQASLLSVYSAAYKTPLSQVLFQASEVGIAEFVDKIASNPFARQKILGYATKTVKSEINEMFNAVQRNGATNAIA